MPQQKLTSADEPSILQPLVRNPSLPPLQPVLSLMTHTGQRPRKVRRIVPDPNRPAVFATFSDVAGDAVKVSEQLQTSIILEQSYGIIYYPL
jgi:hypothetical protein